MLLFFLGFALDLHCAVTNPIATAQLRLGLAVTLQMFSFLVIFLWLRFLLTYMSNSVQDLLGTNRVKHLNIVCSGFCP
jgi:hypothetical protein